MKRVRISCLISGGLKLQGFLILVFEFDATYVIIRHVQRINKWKADQVAFEVLWRFCDIKRLEKTISTNRFVIFDNKKYSYIFE
jgi:hypothetical protein